MNYLKLLDDLETIRELAGKQPTDYPSEKVLFMCIEKITTAAEYWLHSDWQKLIKNMQRIQFSQDGEYTARVFSAYIAEYAGYESRADWIDALMEWQESSYFKRFMESSYYPHYLKKQQKELAKRLFMEELLAKGKKVWEKDVFSYKNVAIGDYVDEEIVTDAVGLLPPAYYSSQCVQMGEPFCIKKDPVSGKRQETYATFSYVAKGVWQYCGHCFLRETVERGIPCC